MAMSVWDKYKTSDDSVICMVGIITLCVSLCKIDGKFTDDEMIEVLDLIPHTDKERDYILDLINQIDSNNLDYSVHAKNIKKYLSHQPKFFDFIIATLYKLAWADHVLDDNELELIKKTHEIFHSEATA
tara:strand:- start:229 stop:615 length:387 start_codon:yes stop_codon:yes gene_type:complete